MASVIREVWLRPCRAMRVVAGFLLKSREVKQTECQQLQEQTDLLNRQLKTVTENNGTHHPATTRTDPTVQISKPNTPIAVANSNSNQKPPTTMSEEPNPAFSHITPKLLGKLGVIVFYFWLIGVGMSA